MASLGLTGSRGSLGLVEQGGSGSGAPGFPVAPGSVLQSRTYFADQLSIPNANWPVTFIAPTDLDNVAASYPVVEYESVAQSGRGWPDFLPSIASHGANPTSMRLTTVYKAGTVPGAATNVRFRLYYVQAPNNTPVGAWQSVALADMPCPTNSNYQYNTQNIVIGAGAGQINLTPGLVYLVEIVREPFAGDLAGDCYVSAFNWAAIA